MPMANETKPLTAFEGLQKALRDAQAFEGSGNAVEAASQYRSAARYMRIFADEALVSDAVERRKAKALEYERRAEMLETGKLQLVRKGGSPAGAPSGPQGAAPVAAQERHTADTLPEAYRMMVAGLRYTAKKGVSWGQIGGLGDVKREIMFSYGMALAQKPAGVRLDSMKNLLFYGPPGTGKTLLAAATAHQLNAAFYNVKAGNLLSKYFGESTKLVSALFDVARNDADTGFAVIFIDEFDALTLETHGSGDNGEQRKVLSTILAEMDGLGEKGENKALMVIAATNKPWDMASAVRSRFQKKIYIRLPDLSERRDILRIHLDGNGFAVGMNYDEMAQRTEKFSGRDLMHLSQVMISKMVEEQNQDIPRHVELGLDGISRYTLKVRRLEERDFQNAMKAVKVDIRKLDEELRRYEEFASSN